MSKIEWTEQTWNPIAGCSIVSPGCHHCYAAKMAKRLAAMGQTKYQGTVDEDGRWTGLIKIDDNALLAPLKRKKPTMYFVNSMSDLFHESVDDLLIDKVFAVMAMCPQHTFQVLTKRADRMRDYVLWPDDCEHFWDGIWCAHDRELASIEERLGEECGDHPRWKEIVKLADKAKESEWPLRNVWLGVSAEDQQRWDERVPVLEETAAAVRFVSAEPLLGFIAPGSELDRLDWLIVGGESGDSRSRPMHPDWVRRLRYDCEFSTPHTAFFFKQWGDWVPSNSNAFGGMASERINAGAIVHDWGDGIQSFKVGKKAAGRTLDGKQYSEMPTAAR